MLQSYHTYSSNLNPTFPFNSVRPLCASKVARELYLSQGIIIASTLNNGELKSFCKSFDPLRRFLLKPKSSETRKASQAHRGSWKTLL